jgi:O-antigen/teichoic acid export membrane protein
VSAVVARARAQLSDPLMRGAYSLMANTILASVLGVAFWIVAARLFPTSEVGRDSALIAAMLTLSGICQLNMVNAIPRFLPQVQDPARTMRTAYLATGAVALVLASAFVVVVPLLVSDLEALGDEPLLAAGFVVATILWGVFGIQDAALAALRRAPWVPVDNAVYNLLKLSALPLMLALGAAFGVFQSWVVPLILTIIPVNLFLFRRVIPAHRRTHTATASPLRYGRRKLFHYLAQDYAATTLAFTALAALPLLVVSFVGSTANAYFYIAFIIVHSLDLLALNAGTSLMVESAFDEERLQAHARTIVRRFLPLMAIASALVVIAAPLLLMPFGAEYADEGATVLRLLGAAVLFRATIILFQVISRARRRGGALLLVDAALFVLVMGLTVALARDYGLTGVGLAWLAANAMVALVLLPSLVRFLRVEGAPSMGERARALVARVGERLRSGETPAPGLLTAAAASCVATVVLVGAGLVPSLAAIALLGVFSLAPGAALLPLIGGRGDMLRVGAIVGVSLALSVVLAMTMLWTGAWEPRPAAVVLAGVCLPILLAHLVRALRIAGDEPEAQT